MNILRCAHVLRLPLFTFSPSSTIQPLFADPSSLPSLPAPLQRYNVFNPKHVHDNGYIYRDLKPENLLIDKEGYITVVDFGFAKKLADSEEDRTYTLCGTVEYFCPEMVAGKGYDRAADIWGVGILVYELIVG
jgi:serine/threonine protein kinase